MNQKATRKITPAAVRLLALDAVRGAVIGMLIGTGGSKVLLGLVLGSMTETNFRRALLISDGSPSIFFQSIYCKIFLALIVVALAAIIRGKLKEAKAAKAAVQKEDN